MTINKLGEFPIIAQENLAHTDFGMSSILPALNEPRYDLVGGGKTYLSYGSNDYLNDLQYLPYKPIPGELDFCDFNADCTFSSNIASGDGVIGMFYRGMSTSAGLLVDETFDSEPVLQFNPKTNLIVFYQDEEFNLIKNNPFVSNVGYKTIVISTNDDLPYSRDKAGNIYAPDYCFIENTVTTFLDFGEGLELNSNGQSIPFYPDPETGIGIGVLPDVICRMGYTYPDPLNPDALITAEKLITVKIHFQAKINFVSLKHSLVSSNINYDLSISSKRYGATVGLTGDNIYPQTQIIKQVGNSVEFATQLLQTAGSPSLFYKIENGEVLERFYFDTVARDDVINFNHLVNNKFNICAYSAGSVISNNRLFITRQSLEALNPEFNADQDILEFNLSVSNADNSPVFSCSDGPYTVIAGAEIDNKQQLIFALRDGTGCYTCDISEYLLNKQLNNFGYENGIIYLGLIDENSEINYTVLIPDLPVAKFEKVTFEFKKLNISFIPCQTHCLAKGGIVSKIY